MNFIFGFLIVAILLIIAFLIGKFVTEKMAGELDFSDYPAAFLIGIAILLLIVLILAASYKIGTLIPN